MAEANRNEPFARRGPLGDLAEQATKDWCRRNAIQYLECAISLMLTTMSKSEVVATLRQEAQHVADFD